MTVAARFLLSLLLVLGFSGSLVRAQPAEEAAEAIHWVDGVPQAVERAKAEDKILLIAINSKFVDGRRDREEPAAKALREIIYPDPRIVKASRDFVCTMVRDGGTSNDNEFLGRLGVGGEIISPQHIFLHPDGETVLLRREYWPFGSGERAVESLLGMMTDARARRSGSQPIPEGGGAQPAPESPRQGPAPTGLTERAPEDPAERAAWIDEKVRQIREGPEEERKKACDALAANDRDGDTFDRLVGLLSDEKKHPEILLDVVRVLGVPDLETAVKPVCDLLSHRDPALRGNAAVTLEYIGSEKAVTDLARLFQREPDESVANHVARALGRCGTGEQKVRALLVNKAGDGSEFASLGPIIGLSYFEGDSKAVREVEEMLRRLGGVGGGRGRGGFANGGKRAVLCWTLSEIGDERSVPMVKETLIDPLKGSQAFWAGPMLDFYDSLVACLRGDEEAKGPVAMGVREVLRRARMPANLMDEARKGRRPTFHPKFDGVEGERRGRGEREAGDEDGEGDDRGGERGGRGGRPGPGGRGR